MFKKYNRAAHTWISKNKVWLPSRDSEAPSCQTCFYKMWHFYLPYLISGGSGANYYPRRPVAHIAYCWVCKSFDTQRQCWMDNNFAFGE